MMNQDKFRMDKRLKPVCVRMTALKVVAIPFSLATASLLANIAEKATDGDVAAVVRASAIVIGLAVLSWAIQSWMETATKRKQTAAENKCRVDFLALVLKSPLCMLSKVEKGALNENINDDISASAKRYTELYPSVLSDGLVILLYTLVLSLASPIVALTLLGLSSLQLLPPVIVKKFMQNSYDECRNIEAQITDHIFEAVKGFEMIKLYGLKQWWLNKMLGYHMRYVHIGRKADAVAAAQRTMYRMTDNILKFGTYILFGIYMMLGYCALDVAVEAIYLSGGLFAGVKAVFSSIPQFAISRSAQKRLDKWAAGGFVRGAAAGGSSGENIALRSLAYAYPNGDGENQSEAHRVVDDLSYEFSVRENYLIKGANGLGKTTLFNLIVGLAIPDAGSAAVGGRESACLEDEAYPGEIFYLPQNDPTFAFSAEELFNMFGEDFRVKMHDLSLAFGLKEENLLSPIADLSGGERKKVFLSLGFSVCPRWLLLDEPSNDLDIRGKEVLLGLIRERRGVIVISHDAAFCEAPNCVLTFHDGVLKETN